MLAASLTACGIALATSGIEIFDLVIGVNLRAHGDRVLMDPDYAEEDAAPSTEGTYGNVTLGFMPVSDPFVITSLMPKLSHGESDFCFILSKFDIEIQVCSSIANVSQVLCQITGLLQTGDSEPATLCQQISSLIKVDEETCSDD